MSNLRGVYGRPSRSARKGLRRKIATMRKQGVAEDVIARKSAQWREAAAEEHAEKPERAEKGERETDFPDAEDELLFDDEDDDDFELFDDDGDDENFETFDED